MASDDTNNNSNMQNPISPNQNIPTDNQNNNQNTIQDNSTGIQNNHQNNLGNIQNNNQNKRLYLILHQCVVTNKCQRVILCIHATVCRREAGLSLHHPPHLDTPRHPPGTTLTPPTPR